MDGPLSRPDLAAKLVRELAVTGGAFFDLDKTLIEGSSAIHFGRAAYRQGLMTRTQLVKDLWANIQFRLKGSTDAGTDELRGRILEAIAGTRVRIWSGWGRRCSRASSRACTRRC